MRLIVVALALTACAPVAAKPHARPSVVAPAPLPKPRKVDPDDELHATVAYHAMQRAAADYAAALAAWKRERARLLEKYGIDVAAGEGWEEDGAIRRNAPPPTEKRQ